MATVWIKVRIVSNFVFVCENRCSNTKTNVNGLRQFDAVTGVTLYVNVAHPTCNNESCVMTEILARASRAMRVSCKGSGNFGPPCRPIIASS